MKHGKKFVEEEYKVYRTKKDKYLLFNNSNLKLGKLMGTKKGFAFVDIEGDDDVFRCLSLSACCRWY